MIKNISEKYKNVIIYFAIKIRNGTLGVLKLAKLMYYLDFDFFEKYGKSVTGDEYLRFDRGPVPRMFKKCIDEMDGKEIKVIKKKLGNGYNDQQCIEPLVGFNNSYFTKNELVMMDEIADKWEKMTGTEMKHASHGEAPWIATKKDAVIDYNLAYYRNKYSEMDAKE